jgi:hypothetical protein
MTTTAFQYVFDNAESISMVKTATTAQTLSRDNTVRTVSRGGQVWRFTVKLPDGIPWTEARPYIESIDYADRYTDGNVQMDNPGYTAWLIPYLGNSANYTGFQASWTQNATTITLTTSPSTASGYKFRTGDVIQLGTGHVYSVVADVAFNSNTVTLNRAILDATGSGNLQVAENVTWNVICTELPNWTIFSRDQVSWSGSFVFYENLL